MVLAQSGGEWSILHYLAEDDEEEQASGGLNHVVQRNAGGAQWTWKKVTVVVDSGAVENVMPQNMFTEIATEETERSNNGKGSKDPEESTSRTVDSSSCPSELLKVRKSTWEVADVRRPDVLASHIIRVRNDLFTGKKWVVRVGSGRVGSGRVGSGRVGSGRVGSGRVDWLIGWLVGWLCGYGCWLSVVVWLLCVVYPLRWTLPQTPNPGPPTQDPHRNLRPGPPLCPRTPLPWTPVPWTPCRWTIQNFACFFTLTLFLFCFFTISEAFR